MNSKASVLDFVLVFVGAGVFVFVMWMMAGFPALP